MKRIAIAVKTTEGGRWILPQIVEARRRGIDVVVILPEGSGRLADEVARLAALDSGLSLMRSPFGFRFALRPSTVIELWRLNRLFRRLDVDAVLYHLYATALAVRIATIGLKARRIHMVAGPLYLESKKIRAFERFLAHRDDVIVCGSDYTAERYRELGMPEKRLVVIPYGVDTEVFVPATTEERTGARVELAVPFDKFMAVMVAYVYSPKRLVFAGRGIKGHAELLEAWCQFHTLHPNSSLIFVGGGFDLSGEIHRQKLIADVAGGLAENGISWLGSIENVRVAYQAADVSVSPSLSENHGAALEASAMGVPPIVSDAGALPEAVTSTSGWIHSAGSVPGLLESLLAAHEEWLEGALESKRRSARALMLDRFDQHRSAVCVLDVVTDRKEGWRTMLTELRRTGFSQLGNPDES